MPLQLPPLSTLFGDSGFTDYTHEEDMKEGQNIDMKIARKKNAKKQHAPWWNYMINGQRKPIETTFSELTALLARKIHAVTRQGFILKVVLVIFAHLIDQFIN